MDKFLNLQVFVGISYADDVCIPSLYHDLLQHALDIWLSLFGLFHNV
jgi:hypothetical protein